MELSQEYLKPNEEGNGGTVVCPGNTAGGAEASGPADLPFGCDQAPSPLLVYNAITAQSPPCPPNEDSDNFRYLNPKIKQGKRLFSALQSGLYWNHDRPIRFMTLTSSNESPADTMASFHHLITTIRRTTPARLIEGHYVASDRLKRYFSSKPVDEPLNVEYMAVLTSEGNGVIHALIIGDYIPQKYISDTWKAIHKAWNVDIRAPRGDKGHQRIARYILAQYVKGQSAIKRINCSQNWIYPGWRSDLKTLVKQKKKEVGDAAGFQAAMLTWTYLMMTRTRLADLNRVHTLADFGCDDILALEKTVYEYSNANYKEWKLNDAM